MIRPHKNLFIYSKSNMEKAVILITANETHEVITEIAFQFKLKRRQNDQKS